MSVFLVAVLVLGVISFDLYSRTKRIREKLRLLQQRMPGFKYGASFTDYRLKGVSGGFAITVNVTFGGNRSRPKITVTCHKATPFKLIILRNESQSDFFTRLAHTPILCSVVKTNDSDFDMRFAVYSHNNTDVAGYFYSTDRKNAVSKIFDLGYTVVEFKGKVVSAQKFDYDVENDLRADIVNDIVGKVCVLARGF